ncbi:exported hypothetical protein [Mesorhizobium plurifarium]|uniref:PA14 domain-containing protein n=1 Tax=Mesorhizobium plurifarium TaxID=69974 RepID=A0A0K2VND7_MESPL|nr:exported hypothetical protein [Mesorhizobium plurifarium]
MIWKYRLTGTAIVAMLAAQAVMPAQAQSTDGAPPSNAELSRRIDVLETKLDAIVEQLNQQEAALDTVLKRGGRMKGDPASGQTGSAGAADGGGDGIADSSTGGEQVQGNWKQGLYLDLYMVPLPDKLDDMAVGPIGVPTASEPVAAPSVFEWNAFTNVPSMRQYATAMNNKRIGLLWSGALLAQESGPYTFVLQVDADRGSNTTACIGVLRMDDQEIVRAFAVTKKVFNRISPNWNDEPKSALDQGSVKLAEGKHRFGLWAHCLGNKADYSKVHFALTAKGPNDRAPKPIDPSRFLIAQD